MWIDVKIPYEPGRKLAEAYNRAMETSSAEWVLLLDHDVSLVCPVWYEMCLKSVQTLNDGNAGLITCVTSGKARSPQLVSTRNTEQINDHINLAYSIFNVHGYALKEINISITGFFMLIRKSAWEKVKFKKGKNGIDKVDIDFSTRLLQNGYTVWLMPGLYVYHRRGLRFIKFK